MELFRLLWEGLSLLKGFGKYSTCFLEKTCPQYGQLHASALVWTRMCALQAPLSLKALSQCEHLYGFSPMKYIMGSQGERVKDRVDY